MASVSSLVHCSQKPILPQMVKKARKDLKALIIGVKKHCNKKPLPVSIDFAKQIEIGNTRVDCAFSISTNSSRSNSTK